MSLILFLACAAAVEPQCPLWFSDLDGDGFGAGEGVASCAPLSARSEVAGDCDDRDSSVNPGAIDPALDGVDQDCDGEDTCAAAIPVATVEEVDCSLGEFSLRGATTQWPEGDCICVAREVYLSAEEAQNLQGGLQRVVETLVLGTPDAPWDGSGLEGLTFVESAELHIDGSANLPSLQQATTLHIRSTTQPSAFSAHSLSEVGELVVEGPVGLSLSALAHTETLELTLLGDDKGEESTELPALESVVQLALGPDARLTLDSLNLAEAVTVQGALDAPALETLNYLAIVDEGSATLPLLREVGSLAAYSEVSPSEVALPDLRLVTRVSVSDGMALQLTGVSDLLQVDVSDGRLHAPLVQKITYLSTRGEAVLDLPLLSEVERLTVAEGYTQFSHPERLSAMEQLSVSGQLSLPALTDVALLYVNQGGEAQLPGLNRVETAHIYESVSFPQLLWVGELNLKGEDHQLPALRGVETLRLWTCPELPSLRYLGGTVETYCTLDLREVTSFQDPLELLNHSGAEVMLPDPYQGAIWLESPSELGTLRLSQLDGALSIKHDGLEAASPETKVSDIYGQLHLSLFSATSLGGLTQVEFVGKDLTYRMPTVPEPEIQAWLTTLYVGGEIIDRCP